MGSDKPARFENTEENKMCLKHKAAPILFQL